MELYPLLKMAHLFGAAVLFGTGAGIAFFMLMAHRRGEPGFIARTGDIVVKADFLFTATAVVAQPITGIWLAHEAGHDLLDGWIVVSACLYVLTGICWLPVVWIQMRLRDLAWAAEREDQPLPEVYHRLFRAWFILGWPAFLSVMAIFWLMVTRPAIW